MANITFTKEDIFGWPLDDERDELLSALTALDLAGRYRTDKYV
jgi:hypothetical protein